MRSNQAANETAERPRRPKFSGRQISTSDGLTKAENAKSAATKESAPVCPPRPGARTSRCAWTGDPSASQIAFDSLDIEHAPRVARWARAVTPTRSHNNRHLVMCL